MQITTQNFSSNFSSSYSRYMPFVAAGFAAGTVGAAAAYFTYRFLANTEPVMTPHVQDNLPIAKNLDTIPDQVGNYDIDGVSFDSEGVVVSGDETIGATQAAKPTVINPS